MAGTIVVDRIESDASYASTINVAGQITFSNTVNFGVYSGTAPVSGFYLPSTSNLAFTTGSTERLRIDNAGNVGIGTASPQGKLDVAGNSYFGTLRLNGNNYSDTIYQPTNDLGLSAASSANIKFNIANTERMRIDSSGNLSVGYAVNGGVWGERVLSFTGVNAGTPSSQVGIGAYNISNTYTGSLIRVQSETGATSAWKMFEGRYAGGGIGYYIDGSGGGYFGGYTGFQVTNPIRTVTINGELAITSSSTSYINISDSAGSNGNARYLVIRGLGSAGTAGNTLLGITLDTSALYVTGAGGNATQAFVTRAWVNFNGTGTIAIRASGNVSSITDGGVGIYRVNFTNSMPDVNYSTTASAAGGGTVNSSTCAMLVNATTTAAAGQTSNVSYVDVFCYHPGNQVAQDNAWISVKVNR